MKIARFSHQDAISYGIVDDGELVVLAGDPLYSGYDTTGERVPLTEATLLAPVIPRSKLVGTEDLADASPVLYFKPNTTVIGSRDVVVRPRQAETTDAAPMLAVIVGRLAKHVDADAAADHIFGYTVAADITARDLYEADGIPDRAKGFDTFTPLGPVIETDAPADSTIVVRHNGAVVLEASVADAVDAAADLLAFASSVATLLPGDVVLVPLADAPVLFGAGDTFESDISGIGVLRTAARDA